MSRDFCNIFPYQTNLKGKFNNNKNCIFVNLTNFGPQLWWMKISEAQQTNSNFPTSIFAETKQYCIQNGFKVEKLQTSPDTASLNWVVFKPFNLVRHFPLKIMLDIQWDKIWILVELVWTFSFGLAPAINQLVSNGGLFPIGKIKYFEKLTQNCEFQRMFLFYWYISC